MIKLDCYKGKRLGILGLGKSGFSIVKAIINSNIKYICYDDSEISRQKAKELLPQIKIAELNDKKWSQIDTLVCSPGINIINHPLYEVIFSNSIEVVCDIELLYNQQHHNSIFFGITGTNGKSTTTHLTNQILQDCGLKAEAGGNIGIPALELSPNTTHYVLELSSYQLDLIHNCKFNAAVLLNITPDHLDRHGNMENYIQSKMKIFGNMDNSNIAIVNIDNNFTKVEYDNLLYRFPEKVIGISTEKIGANIITLKNDIIYDYAFDNQQFSLGQRKYIPGKHNDENILASYALAKTLKLNSYEIIKSILSYKGLEHRMEFVKEIKQTTIINDSKGTNSDATEKALLAYNNIYWIAGGLPKSDGIQGLTYLFPRIKKAYLVGTAKHEFAALMNNSNLPNIICKDLKEATYLALKDALSDSLPNVLLLSPACASWDEWANFEVRGNHFKQFIKEIHYSN